MNKEKSYWQKRCEAAELIIGISGTVDCEGYEQWQTLKEQEPASPSTASNEDKGEETVQTLMQLVRFGWDEAAERILNYCITNKVTPEFSDMIMEMLDEKNKNQFVWEKFESKLNNQILNPKAEQAAKEYAKTDWKNIEGEYVMDEIKYKAFLAGASFNSDAVEKTNDEFCICMFRTTSIKGERCGYCLKIVNG